MLPGWHPQAERRARELLYRCLEELGATKAALYLENGSGAYELAASYGFGKRDALAADVKPGSALLDWVRRHRTAPAYNNDAAADAALGPVVEGAGTARLLTIPLVVGDRLVGLVDARDKGRRTAYAPPDVAVARTIGSALERLLRDVGMYGPAEAAPELELETLPAPPARSPRREEAAAPASPPPVPGGTPAPSPPAPLPPEPRPVRLHAGVVEAAAAFVRTLAELPSIGATALTLTDGQAVRCRLTSGIALEADQRDAIASHQAMSLDSSGLRLPPSARFAWQEDECRSCERRVEAISTAVLLEGPPVWIVLSVLTPHGSSAADAVLAAARAHLQQASALLGYRRTARNLARTLLEPGETAYPHLKQHSQAVSELAQRMSALLGMSEAEEELATLAGYLHDVGMRELDYARIYRAERPGDAERRLYQRHPVLGARLLEGAEFPTDLARAIRHHHERWDGTGYPDRLAGGAIPFASRLVHVAEVWDTLTSAGSYKRPLPREAALDVIRAESGKQFDPEFARVLADVVKS